MSKQTIHKQGGLRIRAAQNAYILILSILLLLVMLIGTLNFLEQSADSIQISGYNRDSSESLLLAESAMNMLYGQFRYKKDIDNDQNNNFQGTPDLDQTPDTNELDTLPLRYSYFVTGGNGIDQALPSLLQRIANGEARNSGSAGNNHSFTVDQNELLVENLYTNSASPIIFVLNNENNLVLSNQTWNELESTNTKFAAAWLEFVRNPALDGTIQIYVQSVSKVGNSKSYVQRYVWHYSDTLGEGLPAITQG